MGARQSKRPSRPPRPRAHVRFDDFEILRAIGRGAFGKVCLVERKENKKVYAMKYVNKEACLKQRAVDNVIAEVDLLRAVDHPFIVSLWFTFQDAEDLFIILEPLMGGDLRFHLNNGINSNGFSEEAVRLVCAEIAGALDYLRSKSIVHRDVKPDNILLDDAGHAHLTDFNVAAFVTNGSVLRNLAGTKPYMAPEVFKVVASPTDFQGYSFAVDWWSLGVTAYELKTGGERPFEINPKTSLSSAGCLIEAARESMVWPNTWSPEFSKFVASLLAISPEKRITTMAMAKKTKLMSNMKVNQLMSKKYPPPFVPNQEGLNCDPTYELEEMIVEAKPLHKKKKRLLRQQSLLSNSPSSNNSIHGSDASFHQTSTEGKFSSFPTYSREWERYQDSLREKERAWELELMRLMEASTLTAAATIASNNASSSMSNPEDNVKQ